MSCRILFVENASDFEQQRNAVSMKLNSGNLYASLERTSFETLVS